MRKESRESCFGFLTYDWNSVSLWASMWERDKNNEKNNSEQKAFLIVGPAHTRTNI
jgi:hypothetical protein